MVTSSTAAVSSASSSIISSESAASTPSRVKLVFSDYFDAVDYDVADLRQFAYFTSEALTSSKVIQLKELSLSQFKMIFGLFAEKRPVYSVITDNYLTCRCYEELIEALKRLMPKSVDQVKYAQTLRQKLSYLLTLEKAGAIMEEHRSSEEVKRKAVASASSSLPPVNTAPKEPSFLVRVALKVLVKSKSMPTKEEASWFFATVRKNEVQLEIAEQHVESPSSTSNLSRTRVAEGRKAQNEYTFGGLTGLCEDDLPYFVQTLTLKQQRQLLSCRDDDEPLVQKAAELARIELQAYTTRSRIELESEGVDLESNPLIRYLVGPDEYLCICYYIEPNEAIKLLPPDLSQLTTAVKLEKHLRSRLNYKEGDGPPEIPTKGKDKDAQPLQLVVPSASKAVTIERLHITFKDGVSAVYDYELLKQLGSDGFFERLLRSDFQENKTGKINLPKISSESFRLLFGHFCEHRSLDDLVDDASLYQYDDFLDAADFLNPDLPLREKLQSALLSHLSFAQVDIYSIYSSLFSSIQLPLITPPTALSSSSSSSSFSASLQQRSPLRPLLTFIGPVAQKMMTHAGCMPTKQLAVEFFRKRNALLREIEIDSHYLEEMARADRLTATDLAATDLDPKGWQAKLDQEIRANIAKKKSALEKLPLIDASTVSTLSMALN